jgi:hypothetical protein
VLGDDGRTRPRSARQLKYGAESSCGPGAQRRCKSFHVRIKLISRRPARTPVLMPAAALGADTHVAPMNHPAAVRH